MNFQVVGAALLLLIMQLNGSMADNLTATDTENLPGECEGRVVCPAVIKVRWNEPLCREPHLIKHENGTKITYDGIFPRKLRVANCFYTEFRKLGSSH